MLKKLLASCAVVALVGCSTVTINPEKNLFPTAQPSYEDSKPFYLWGLVGENRVNVTEVCGPKGPVQMQTQQTFADGFLTVITLGIYAPHTAKVWCK